MRKRTLMFLVLLGAFVTVSDAELRFKALSVTATSQTYFLTRPQEVVSLCNLGANEAYFRLFWEGETTAAATTSSSVLPAGTAAAPYCVGFGTAKTQPGRWIAVAIVCDTAETATVHIQSE